MNLVMFAANVSILGIYIDSFQTFQIFGHGLKCILFRYNPHIIFVTFVTS